ncbi:MAG: hypothetical protein PHG95_02260 [Patescibacteria group bacterium]|nr:hypothetical protein [Patescibacteria group bacterium]
MKFSKFISRWWHRRRERFYRQNRWHLVLDISLAVLILLLIGVSLRLALYNPAVISALNNSFHQLNGGQDGRILDIKTEISGEKNYIEIGDNLEWRLHYRNTGNTKIDDLNFSLDFDSAAFSWKIMEADDSANHPLSLEGGKIKLKDVAAGEEGDILFKASWQTEKKDFPRSIKGKLIAKASAGGLLTSKEISWPAINILSDLQLKATLYFHSPQGDQLGIGPVPPIVGVPTKYWLIVKALNNGNDLENFVFSAKLPVGVELDEEQSLLAGKSSYNPDSRLLVWQLDSLAPAGGDYIANFALVLTPSADQVGKDAPLLLKLQYRAQDLLTGVEISGFLPDLDSSLPDDPINHGQGKVTE